MGVAPAGPLDVRAVLRTERTLLVDLLRTMQDADWHQPTACPAYDVQGIAAHLLCGDFSLLSRQRDVAPDGLLTVVHAGADFRSAVDRFNDRWVEAVAFFSPAVLIELLDLTGHWTADWYDRVDPASSGEPVGFFNAIGPSLQARRALSSPYWQIAAREYFERWVHHHQIRRALTRPDLDEDAILAPAAAAVVRSLAAHLDGLETGPGVSVVFSVEGLTSWTFGRDLETWQLFDGRAGDAVAELSIDRAVATPLLSRGLGAREVEAAFSVTGDTDLAVARRPGDRRADGASLTVMCPDPARRA